MRTALARVVEELIEAHLLLGVKAKARGRLACGRVVDAGGRDDVAVAHHHGLVQLARVLRLIREDGITAQVRDLRELWRDRQAPPPPPPRLKSICRGSCGERNHSTTPCNQFAADASRATSRHFWEKARCVRAKRCPVRCACALARVLITFGTRVREGERTKVVCPKASALCSSANRCAPLQRRFDSVHRDVH